MASSSCGWMPRPTDSAPCGSKSTSSTAAPDSASAAPRLIVVVVLPTPPFWLHTATTRAGPCSSRGSGSGNTGSGRPVGPMHAGTVLPSSLDADTVTSTSPAAARNAGRCLPDSRACIGSRQADSPFARKRLAHTPWSGPACLVGYAPASAERAGMGGRVDLAQPVDGDQRVDLGGGHRGVAEQFLDDPDVGAAVEQVGGERVAQRVRGDLGQARPGPPRPAARPRRSAGSAGRRGRSGTPPGCAAPRRALAASTGRARTR